MTPCGIELIVHPDTPRPEGARIRVDLNTTASGDLRLRYSLSADLDTLRIPDPGAVQRLDGLWRHTCFEVFLLGADGHSYREWNIAPSGAWQAYDFRAYRDAGGLSTVDPPVITRLDYPGLLQIDVALSAAGRALKRLGLSAVLETRTGALSYWALRHTPGQPDFHHTDAFALEPT